MAYLGNRPATGENNAFRILDDISSHVVSFDGSSASVVSLTDDTITITDDKHRYVTGQRITYGKGGGTVITGLTDATAYYVIRDSATTIQLATTASNANNGVAVNLTGLGAGTAHTITLAFDGVNTKFKPTYLDGTQNPLITRAAQLVISINGVIQQPHDSASPTSGFGIDTSNGDLIFSQAPNVNDDFWGHVHASNTVTFDISDNKVDNFTKWLEAQDEVNHVTSLAHTMKNLNKSMHGDDPEWEVIPESEELSSQYLFFYEMSLPMGLDLNSSISQDRSSTKISANLDDMSGKEFLEFDKKVRAHIQENNLTEIISPAAGFRVVFSHISTVIINSLLFGVFLGLL